MHLFPTCGTKINTFLRLKLHRRRFCCANHNRTRGTPCRLPIVSFSLYHASFHLSLLNLQTGMGNYPFSLFTLPQILRWPRVVFLPVFCLGFSPQHQTSTACFATCGRNRATLVLTCSPVCSPTSTPKPRAEGSSPSAPATKPAKTLGFRRFSFFMCCIAIWCILVRISGFPTRPYRLHPSPAPKTHPVSPFSGFSGCVFAFFAVLWAQNFRTGFCASCRTAITG